MLSCFLCSILFFFFFFFFFNDTATTEIYTLSLHDALPIQRCPSLYVVLAYPPTRVGPTPATCWRSPYSSARTVHSRYSARCGGRHVKRNSSPPTAARKLESGSVPYSAVPPTCT